MNSIRVSAPGKLHILGEHSVVYGKPAIIAAVDRRCFAEIKKRKDNVINIISKNFKKPTKTNFSKVFEKYLKAKKDWDKYNKNNDINLLRSITKNPLDYPLLIIGEFFNYLDERLENGFELIIDSKIPVGSGMGSSGALAVAIIGALCLLTDRPFDKKVINRISFLCEQKKHGNPSGGDNMTSSFGGLIWYEKDKKMKTLNFVFPKKLAKNFYVVNTGSPSETTGEMVSMVKNLHSKDPRLTQSIFDEQRKLVIELLPALQKGNGNEIIRIIKSGEKNLESLGVVSDSSKILIRKIEEIGGAAKICGAGGRKDKSGMILVFHSDERRLQDLLRLQDLNISQLSLGAEGLRIEK